MLWPRLEKVLPRVEKPARYIGDEINAVVKDDVDFRFGLAFPDVYEIGSSYLGYQILYSILNKLPGVQAERIFAPWSDMEQEMRANNIPLYGMETKNAVADFDVLGFTLQYELGYTNILNMLDLAGLPLLAQDRVDGPIVIGGGPGALHPEPLAVFFDAFVIGEGEEIVSELVETIRSCRDLPRVELLSRIAAIPGVYVPRFYAYSESGVVPVGPEYSPRLTKRIVREFAGLDLPSSIIVPHIRPIHDRVSLEVRRGCARGCRFCQAGMAYRPVRERGVDQLYPSGVSLMRSSGSNEVGLSSLSSADYSGIEPLARHFMDAGAQVALPSLRVDSYSVQLAKLTGSVRKSGLTLAPEAGTQRLRDVINKNVSEENIMEAAGAAFENGWHTIKLYFMMGLPTETREDVEGIVKLCWRLVDLYKEITGSKGRLKINVGVSTFVPKPHTPFQWAGQLDKEEVFVRQEILRTGLQHKRFKLQVTDWRESSLEAVLARGDRLVGEALLRAWQLGCKFDAWREHFRHDLWVQAFAETGVDIEAFTGQWDEAAALPWDHIDIGVNKQFLALEYQRALAGEITPDCTLDDCSLCGVCPTYGVEPLKRGGDR